MQTLFKTTAAIAPLLLVPYLYCDDKASIYDKNPNLTLKKRNEHLQQIQKSPDYDVVVIGGGCNGAGVVLDASTRGLKTLLIEKNDFGSGTSSKSTKLIHGGVRYLQQVFAWSADSLKNRWQKFQLVKQGITQRGQMIRSAEYMNQKIPFIIPCSNSLYSTFYYVGSIMYYMIYWFNSPSNTVGFNFPYFLHRNQLRKYFPFISDRYQSGVVYEDGQFNDARMVLMSLLTTTVKAQQFEHLPSTHCPSNIVNQAEFIDFIKDGAGTITGVRFRDKMTDKQYQVNAKYVVNCTGAWSDVIRLLDNPEAKKRMVIVGGSHITYSEKLGRLKYGLCVPSKDGRILLVVPWLKRFIAGTTERTFEQAVENPVVSHEERTFIQNEVVNLMQKLPAEKLIEFEVAKWAGLRPLVSNSDSFDTKDIARNHVIEKSSSGLLSLMGGKWTAYRRMGEDLVDEIVTMEKQKGVVWPASSSRHVRLIGSCSSKLLDQLVRTYGAYGRHLYHQYGGLCLNILRGNLDQVFEHVTVAELQHIIQHEMVTSVEDVLMRRLRLSFLYPNSQVLQLVPIVATMLYNRNAHNNIPNPQSLQQLIQSSIQTINSYQF